MTRREIRPSAIHGRVRAPPSKSYTHRALVLAYLAGRPFTIVAPLVSDDTLATAGGLRALGARIRTVRGSWRVEPPSGDRVPTRARVECGASGTTLRFLLPLATRSASRVSFAGTRRLAERPVAALLRTLGDLGASVRPSRHGGLPVAVRGPIRGGRATVAVGESSQFLSGLLLTLPTLEADSELTWDEPPVSWPYVQATVAVLRSAGVMVGLDAEARRSRIPGGQRPAGRRFRVPGDASSAAYLWVAAALTGGKVRVDGLASQWPQADRRILSILAAMGSRVVAVNDTVSVEGPVDRPIEVDLTDTPDLAPLVGVLASSVAARSILRGGPHLAAKESDRRAATAQLARSFGAKVTTLPNAIIVRGRSAGLAAVRENTLTDHRLVMSAAVGALAASGTSSVGSADAVRKSFPQFWDVLDRLGADLKVRR
ncbi:MAG: 3-phosphoshikimate 1-carboxyvinyltransferase [Thermoplasmata archaeon]